AGDGRPRIGRAERRVHFVRLLLRQAPALEQRGAAQRVLDVFGDGLGAARGGGKASRLVQARGVGQPDVVNGHVGLLVVDGASVPGRVFGRRVRRHPARSASSFSIFSRWRMNNGIPTMMPSMISAPPIVSQPTGRASSSTRTGCIWSPPCVCLS